ncbi:hypothetical protein MauCBS54593_000687 [Microsporum audouinii]
MDELRGKNGGYPRAPELVPLLEKAHENVNSSLTVGGSINGNVSSDAVQADSLQQDLHSRPEHAIFGLAMIGGGEITGGAHVEDFPWESLGEATVVDVGGGAGKNPEK